MYAPIPDVVLPIDPEIDSEQSSGPVENHSNSNKLLLNDVVVGRFLWRAFLGSFAFASLMFGTYICSFYLQSLVKNEMNAWEVTGPGMYHEDRWDGNWALGAHFVGGAYLMLLGPLQFIPGIRKKCMILHRWNGRLAIVGSLLTSLGGIYYVCAVGSSNVPIVGQSANWNNVIFGTAMLICGMETFRHAAITKRIDSHKLWAYRIAALGLGGIFIRIGTTTLLIVLKIDNGTKDDPKVFKEELVHSQVYKCGLNVLVSTNHIPFLLLANQVWKLEQQRGESSTRTILFLIVATSLLVLFVSGIALLVLHGWLPFIGHSLDYYYKAALSSS